MLYVYFNTGFVKQVVLSAGTHRVLGLCPSTAGKRGLRVAEVLLLPRGTPPRCLGMPPPACAGFLGGALCGDFRSPCGQLARIYDLG